MNNIQIEYSSSLDAAALHDIWYRSVQKSHKFLNKADFEAISPLTKIYLNNTSVLIAVQKPRLILGFMGMTGNKIDSLFIEPDFFRQGVGRYFVEYAKFMFENLLVDVNEQNDGAVAFYKRLRFSVIGRSETDDEGRPYPLLYMAYGQNLT